MTLRVMSVYGTRPEAIKFAPLVKALEQHRDTESIVAVTGQHREMLDQVNHLFGIVPTIDLDIMRAGQTLHQIIERTLAGLTPLLEAERPDYVVVQGDTTTTFAAAMAAAFLQIPVVHLEAGLRSGDRHSPFPEELNRKATSQLADLHLAPTPRSRANLEAEGIAPDDIAVTGNTVIDALLEAVTWDTALPEELDRVAHSGRRVVTVTTHRRENLGAGMASIGRSLAAIAERFPDVELVLPIHRNPAVRAAVLPEVEGHPNITVTEPLDYDAFATLLDASHLVVTDSGGVQEEAPSLGKPVLVMRDTTERPEAVDHGTVELVGTDERTIVERTAALLTDEAHYTAMARATNPYGDGRAAGRCVAAILHHAGLGERAPDFSPA